MKTLEQISLKENERQAILELKKIIQMHHPNAALILFESKASGEK